MTPFGPIQIQIAGGGHKALAGMGPSNPIATAEEARCGDPPFFSGGGASSRPPKLVVVGLV